MQGRERRVETQYRSPNDFGLGGGFTTQALLPPRPVAVWGTNVSPARAPENRVPLSVRSAMRRDRERNAEPEVPSYYRPAVLGGVARRKAGVQLTWNQFVEKLRTQRRCTFQEALVLASPLWKVYKRKHASAV